VGGQVMLAQERHGNEQPNLCQGSKILALGCLAAEVAHDFNNLLTPIVLAMSDIVDNPGDASALQTRNAQRALACAGRAQHLVRRLLSFARLTPMQTEAVDVADLIRGTHELFLSAPGYWSNLKSRRTCRRYSSIATAWRRRCSIS
jgi:C4-dicarboxylate-specific signal transduction histidine kinase